MQDPSTRKRGTRAAGGAGGGVRGGQAVLRDIIAQLADGIVVVDGGGVIRFANPAALRLFRREAPALIGMDFGFPVVAGEIAEIEVVQPADEGRGPGVVTAELRVVDITWDEAPASLVSLRD